MEAFKNWLAKPFNADMSATRWFAFVGLLIAISMAWHVILKRMEG